MDRCQSRSGEATDLDASTLVADVDSPSDAFGHHTR